MTRPSTRAAFVFRSAPSLPIGAAVLRLVVSACETIVISTIVFGRTGDGRQGGDGQSHRPSGDGDQGPRGFSYRSWLSDPKRCLAECERSKSP